MTILAAIIVCLMLYAVEQSELDLGRYLDGGDDA